MPAPAVLQPLNIEDPNPSESRYEPSDDSGFQTRLTLARNGNVEALGAMIVDCEPHLTAIARQAIPQALRAKIDASDAVQETSLRAHRDFAAFLGTTPDEFRNWLRRILLNTVAMQRRGYDAEKRRIGRETRAEPRVDSLPNPIDGQVTPSSWLIKREQRERLEEGLNRLPEHLSRVVRLRNLERLSFVEIGKLLGRSDAAARKLWVRAITRLQKELRERGDADR